MKNFLNTVLLCGLICGIVSCSNGDYEASPDSNANGAVNPVTPLTQSEFTWSGTDPMSADINGSRWVADSVSFNLDTSGGNIIVGAKYNSTPFLRFYLKDVWTNNLYDMEWENYNRFAQYIDSIGYIDGTYSSYLSNSGGITILQNDTAVIKGLFYFKGISPNGKIVNISNGYFKIDKY
jgi:hypothetical protein